MTGIPDELVEKAIDAWSHDVVHDDPYRGPMRAALEAVGLPALLERVEAAEEQRRYADQRSERYSALADEMRGRANDALARSEKRGTERDALAAKVAQLREQVAYLERSRDNVCETAERDRGDALRELSAVRGAGSALLTLKDGPRDDAYYAAKDQAWADLRAALTEGTEG